MLRINELKDKTLDKNLDKMSNKELHDLYIETKRAKQKIEKSKVIKSKYEEKYKEKI